MMTGFPAFHFPPTGLHASSFPFGQQSQLPFDGNSELMVKPERFVNQGTQFGSVCGQNV
jgi:hypothetical protein